MTVRITLAFAAALLAVPSPGRADCYIKSKVETSGFAGLGGTKGKTEKWISGKRSAERTEMEIKSPVLKLFMDGEKSRTITDLERGVIVQVDEEKKTYREVSFQDLHAQVEASREKYREAMKNAEESAEQPMPKVEAGTRPEVEVELLPSDETKKFAGIEAKRSTTQLLSHAVDPETGEEITYKILYDAWLAPDFPAEEDLSAYGQACAESFGTTVQDMADSGELGMLTALGNAGLDRESMTSKLGQLDGYPMKVDVKVGIRLTPEQRKEMAEQMAEREKDSGGGGLGGLSLGGLKKKVTDTVTGEITDRMVESLFGEGVTVDGEGDPVFFSMTSEVEKVELKPVDEKRFTVDADYKVAGP